MNGVAARTRTVAACALLFLLTAALYRPLVGYRSVDFDDAPYLHNNPAVRAGLTWEGVRFAFTDLHSAGNWHPVTWLSLMAGVQAHGVDPAPHLATNVLLHGAVASLLLVALLRITGAFWPSALVAALFAAHPLSVETVAWLPERKDLLTALFWVLSLLAYRGYVARPALPRYLLVVLTLCLGLMSKPMMITLPAVLLLLDLWPLGRFSGAAAGAPAWRRPVLEKLPLLALSLAAACVNLAALSGGGLRPTTPLTLLTGLAVAPATYLRYVAKAVWPAGLAFFHPASGPPPAWQAAGAALLLAAVTAAAAGAWRSRPHVAVGWLWFLATLFPVVGVVRVNEVSFASRYAYLPLVGLFVAAAWSLVPRGAGRVRRSAMVAAAFAALCALAIAARAQLGHWRDAEALLRHDLAVTAGNWLAEYNLGLLLAASGRTDEAATHYREAIRIQPAFLSPHNNLGVLLAQQGRLRESLAEFLAALRIDPRDAVALNNAGSVLLRLGDTEAAAGHFRRALDVDPTYAEASNNLGLVQLRRGKVDAALASFTEAARLKPDYADALYHRGVALQQLGRHEEARRAFRDTVAVDPAHRLARERLAAPDGSTQGGMP